MSVTEIPGHVVERALLNSSLEKVAQAACDNHKNHGGKGCVLIIQPDYTFEVIPRGMDEGPSLKELQEWVAGPDQTRGLIQPVDYYLNEGFSLNGEPSTAYANEEGLYVDGRVNMLGATVVKWPEPLVGVVVVLVGCYKNE